MTTHWAKWLFPSTLRRLGWDEQQIREALNAAVREDPMHGWYGFRETGGGFSEVPDIDWTSPDVTIDCDADSAEYTAEPGPRERIVSLSLKVWVTARGMPLLDGKVETPEWMVARAAEAELAKMVARGSRSRAGQGQSGRPTRGGGRGAEDHAGGLVSRRHQEAPAEEGGGAEGLRRSAVPLDAGGRGKANEGLEVQRLAPPDSG